jgi:ribonuclease J
MAKTKKQDGTAVVPNKKLKIVMLGGLNEVGKNLAVLEYDNNMIVIDCGLGFPDDDMLGVDLVIPDATYLEKNVDKIKGIFLTHGHEDHIGALPYVLQNVNVPVYGTRLTLGILEIKLSEHRFTKPPVLNCVAAGDVITVGPFSIEFIRVNHSIADACALAITTPLGVIIYSGDFKLDLTPVESKMMDITRLGEYGNNGVMLLMCESTNAERPGYTPSEKKVGMSLDIIFNRNSDKRIVIATFSSNVHRVQQIIDISASYKRKVAITGRSMLNVIKAATELGYMRLPDGVVIDINDIKRFPPEQTTIITTGSQGEPMSALYRMAFSDHDKIELGLKDLVVLSAYAIPGNEKLVDKIVNELFKKGVKVFRDSMVEVHVSGHACQEELKLMHALTRPKYFMPVHGEIKHLMQHKELAVYMGMPESNIFVSDIGKVLEIDSNGARFNGVVPSGRVLVDGYGVGDVGNIVLRDRRHLAQDGLIVVVATVDTDDKVIISGPDIISRGFVYVRESEELMDQVKMIARDALNDCIDNNIIDWTQLKTKVKDDLSKFLYAKTKRKPMILPVVMNV